MRPGLATELPATVNAGHGLTNPLTSLTPGHLSPFARNTGNRLANAVPRNSLLRIPRMDRLHHRLRRRGCHLVAPGALRARHEELLLVLGGGLGEVGVRGRLLHRACVLRPLARDLAGVGHAYPSPIG
ncbi:hypothetical protein Saa2_08519 [Streptomyces acidiscabies]|nr:hypothetical protein Saa2_08519 [Streptomyces acidiscabies]